MLISAALWGFIGVFTRELSDAGFSAMETAFLRMLIGAVILVAFYAVADRAAFKIKKRDLILFLLFGFFKIMSDFFLFMAQVRIQLSLSTVLQLTSPYWVLFFSMFLFGEKITARKVFAICMAFFGCIFASGLVSDDIRYDFIGTVFALLSGIMFAGYFVGNKILMNKGYSTGTIILYIFICSSIVSFPFSDPLSLPGLITSWDVVLNLLGIGILMSLVPYCLQVYSLKYLSPVQSNLIGITEVFFAVLVGYVLYCEKLGIISLIGMILIPLSIAVMNINPRQMLVAHRKKKSAEQ